MNGHGGKWTHLWDTWGVESIGLGDCLDEASDKGKTVVKNDSQTAGLSSQMIVSFMGKEDTWG